MYTSLRQTKFLLVSAGGTNGRGKHDTFQLLLSTTVCPAMARLDSGILYGLCSRLKAMGIFSTAWECDHATPPSAARTIMNCSNYRRWNCVPLYLYATTVVRRLKYFWLTINERWLWKYVFWEDEEEEVFYVSPRRQTTSRPVYLTSLETHPVRTMERRGRHGEIGVPF